MPNATRCHATNHSGDPCSAAPLPGQGWCVWHHPDRAEARREMSRKGGLAKRNTVRAKKRYAEGGLDPDQSQGIIGATIVGVLSERIPPNVGNAIAALARTSVAIREAVETEERLAALERRAGIDRKDRIA